MTRPEELQHLAVVGVKVFRVDHLSDGVGVAPGRKRLVQNGVRGRPGRGVTPSDRGRPLMALQSTTGAGAHGEVVLLPELTVAARFISRGFTSYSEMIDSQGM